MTYDKTNNSEKIEVHPLDAYTFDQKGETAEEYKIACELMIGKTYKFHSESAKIVAFNCPDCYGREIHVLLDTGRRCAWGPGTITVDYSRWGDSDYSSESMHIKTLWCCDEWLKDNYTVVEQIYDDFRKAYTADTSAPLRDS